MDSDFNKVTNYIKNSFNIVKMKICFIITFLIGMIAHGYVFLNAMYAHDSVSYGISKNLVGGIISGTARTTPFASVWNIFMAECKTVWLAGIIILICYSFSSYLVSEVLMIDNKVLVALLSGIMVVSPTTIAANTYAVDCGNAFTLLFSCIAAYFFFKDGIKSKIFFIISMIIAVGSYGPFISLIFTIIMIRIFSDYYIKPKFSLFIRKFVLLVMSCAIVIGLLLLFSIVVGRSANVELQGRVTGVLTSNATEQEAIGPSFINSIFSTAFYYVSRLLANILNTILFYFPQRVAYRLGVELPANSFFVENKMLLVTFYIACIACICTVIKEAINRKSKSLILAFVATVFILIMAMDIYGAVTWSHLLMRYSYIAPWFLMFSLADVYESLQENNTGIHKVYTRVVCLLGVVTTISGIYLANEVYAKEEAVYKSGLLLANRVADHIEAVDGYIPGETKVYVVGNLREHYAPIREEFNFIRDVTGAGSPYWDTAIPLYWSFTSFMSNQVGVSINYAVIPPFDYVYDAEGYADILIDAGYEIDKDEFISGFEMTNSFPNDNCYYWCGDILVFKLSEGLNLQLDF